jgi:hypothetical protein
MLEMLARVVVASSQAAPKQNCLGDLSQRLESILTLPSGHIYYLLCPLGILTITTAFEKLAWCP